MPARSSLRWGSLEVPWPSWASGPLAVLVLLGLSGFGGFWAWERIDYESKRISPADLVQLEHASIHLTESPQGTFTVFDDPRGALLVKFYASDSCTLIERHFANAPTTTRFVPDMGRGMVRAASPAALSGAAWAQGRCIDVATHPGEVKTWNEAVDQCVVRAWRAYPDGCSGFTPFDRCSSVWGAWNWSRCVH